MDARVELDIDEAEHDPDELKEVKVQIRISQHIKLHSLRLLEEQNLSETVRRALDLYFETLDEEDGGDVDEAVAVRQ